MVSKLVFDTDTSLTMFEYSYLFVSIDEVANPPEAYFTIHNTPKKKKGVCGDTTKRSAPKAPAPKKALYRIGPLSYRSSILKN